MHDRRDSARPDASANQLAGPPGDQALDPIGRPIEAAAIVQTPSADQLTRAVSWLTRMPKAELHLHLDGSLRPETALELAHSRDVEAPRTLEAMHQHLIAPMPCRDQAELLRAFDLPIALLQDAEALQRATHELVEDVALDGTRYVEIRWGPSLHTARGLSLRDGIRAVIAGAHAGSAVTGTTVRLIACALRMDAPEQTAAVARAAADFIADGLVGFDLAGPEAAFPDPLIHREAFEIARAAGLGITLHAGEWGGAAQVRRALALDPARIAHGAPAIDDPALVAELRARGVTLDLCPTSNVQAGIVGSLAAHPLGRLQDAGVQVTLSTDDRTVSDLTLVEEYIRAISQIGRRPADLWRINRAALDAAFLHHDEELRARLISEFDAFASADPPLS